jgi:hypothetical protein
MDAGTSQLLFSDLVLSLIVIYKTDGNGTIDLNEFLLGMTLENTKTDERLAKAFFNFGKMHRRHTLIEYLEDENVEDSKKFKEFGTLFGVHKEFPDKAPTTVTHFNFTIIEFQYGSL